MSHSPEPWKEARLDDEWETQSSMDYYTWPIIDANGTAIVSQGMSAVNAARVVACVNFCAGLSTDEMLSHGDGGWESFVITRAIEAAKEAARHSITKSLEVFLE